MSKSKITVGAGKATIVFPEEIYPIENFKGQNDDINVRMVVVKGDVDVAIVSFELVALWDDKLDMVKEIIKEINGVDPKNTWVHVTHAISTPHEPREKGAQADMFINAVMNAAKEAAEKAAANMQEATLTVCKGESYTNTNRDIETSKGWWIGLDGPGPSNRTVTVLKFDALDGSPISLIYSFGIKPCAIDVSTFDDGMRLVSSDVTGEACRVVEEEYKVPVLFLMSASGDQVPKEMAWYCYENEEGEVVEANHGDKAYEMVDRLGKQLGKDVLAALNNVVEKIENPVMKKGETTFTYAGKKGPRMSDISPTKVQSFEPDGDKTLPVEAIAIGDFAFVGSRPETNCITEQELWECSPYDNTILISMYNGGMKYMADKKSYERVTFESQNSRLMAGAAEKFVETACSLLNELKNK